MRELILFAIAPYLAMGVAVIGLLRHLLGAPPERDRKGDDPARLPRQLSVGLAVVLTGHLLGVLIPKAILRWNQVPGRLLLLEATGLAFSCLAISGYVALVRSRGRLRRPTSTIIDTATGTTLGLVLASGVFVALRYRWSSSWYAATLAPYLESLVRLHPDPSALGALPFMVRFHAVSSLLLVALAPYSSAAALLPRLGLVGKGAGKERDIDGPERRWRRQRSLVLALGAVLAVATIAAGSAVALSLERVGIAKGYAPEQPIAFSHRLHAGKYQVPCLYCHFGAERSRHAGIPPLATCMNCHRQLSKQTVEIAKLKEAYAQKRPIAWIKVHNLPDFVYFNHSRHVLGGVQCQECHGPIETMERVRQEAELTMGWCLRCHRGDRPGAPAPTAVLAQSSVPRSLTPLPNAVAVKVRTDCSRCHH